MVKNRGGENGMIFPGGENGISLLTPFESQFKILFTNITIEGFI